VQGSRCLVGLTIILNVCASRIDKSIDGFPAFRKPFHNIDNIIVNTGFDNIIERVRPVNGLAQFKWSDHIIL